MTTSRNLTGKKILLIEDNLFLSDLIIKKLESEGAEVRSYGNGLEGLAGIRNEDPDLILLDIAMPVMNGYEVLQVMHAESLTSKIPVIVISNSGQPVEIERVKELGVRDYLVKVDFEPDEVIEKVYAVLGIENTTPTPVQEAVPVPPTATEATGKGVKVFVVEDDPMLRNMMAVKLSNSACPYMFSNDGAQALELAQRFSPDIIVLDLMLPGKDGFAVLKDLKADDSTANVPVVIFSNKDTNEDRQKARELGADKYYVKAMTDLDEFITDLKRLAKQRQTDR